MSSNFRYHPSVAVSGKLGGNIRVVDDIWASHDQEISRTTSLDDNCIEFDFQADRNYYVDLKDKHGFQTEICQGLQLQTYHTKEIKEEPQEKAKLNEEMEEEQEAPLPLITPVNIILHLIFW